MLDSLVSLPSPLLLYLKATVDYLQIDLDEFVNMVAPIVSETNKTDPFAEPAASANPTTK